MLYFKTRVLARAFAKKTGVFADCGSDTVKGRRWAVKVL